MHLEAVEALRGNSNGLGLLSRGTILAESGWNVSRKEQYRAFDLGLLVEKCAVDNLVCGRKVPFDSAV